MALSEFVPVAKLEDIPDGGALQVEAGGELIGLFRVGEEVFALCDVCTHEEAYLTEGDFDPEELEVECPLHGSRFDVRNGGVRILPATKPEKTYPVKIEDGQILVGPSEAAK